MFKAPRRAAYYAPGGMRMKTPLTDSLAQNKKLLQDYFGEAIDFYTKDITLCGVACCICMFEGLSSIERLWIMMLDAMHNAKKRPRSAVALYRFMMHDTAIPFESASAGDLTETVKRLTSGASVILIDGCPRAVVISTQSMQYRSVQEPSGEGNVRGSREGFTEPLRVNISLVRRLIRTGDLMVETRQIGKRTQTEIALLYNAKLVPKSILEQLRARISASDLPFVFDTGYLASFLQRGAFSVFQSVGYTERPDTAAAKICEGKVVVLANGSPFAMLVPYFFTENFQSMDDYSEKAYFASFIRLVKYTAFLLAVMLPGLFVSIANFTPELLPKQLLYKVAAAEQGTPMPLFLEMLFVIFLLELVREAGLRLPKPIGHSVSLVAALIVGDAAISAGLIGTPVVIIAAITAICGYVLPSLYEPITLLRMLFIVAGGVLGPLGIVAALFFMLISACGMQAFGIPYTAPLAPGSSSAMRDALVRADWRTLAAADFTLDDMPREDEQ